MVFYGRALGVMRGRYVGGRGGVGLEFRGGGQSSRPTAGPGPGAAPFAAAANSPTDNRKMSSLSAVLHNHIYTHTCQPVEMPLLTWNG